MVPRLAPPEPGVPWLPLPPWLPSPPLALLLLHAPVAAPALPPAALPLPGLPAPPFAVL